MPDVCSHKCNTGDFQVCFFFLFYHTSHAELLGETPSPWMRGGWIVVRHVCELHSRSADCWSQLALQACRRNLTARRWTHSCKTQWNKHGCCFISEISRRPGDFEITSVFPFMVELQAADTHAHKIQVKLLESPAINLVLLWCIRELPPA